MCWRTEIPKLSKVKTTIKAYAQDTSTKRDTYNLRFQVFLIQCANREIARVSLFAFPYLQEETAKKRPALHFIQGGKRTGNRKT